MKLKLGLLTFSIALIAFAPGLQLPLAAQLDRLHIPAEKRLPEVAAVTNVRVDDPAHATGLPTADLVIKDMCFEKREPAGFNSVRVLIANIGTVDAGPFELGFNYVHAEGSSKYALDKIKGLKVGEEHWEEQFHTCCGFVSSMFLVDWASKYEAIADPRYFRSGSLPTQRTEVKSVIPESNKSNNKKVANKSDLRSCTTVTKIDTPGRPKIQPIQVRPPKP